MLEIAWSGLSLKENEKDVTPPPPNTLLAMYFATYLIALFITIVVHNSIEQCIEEPCLYGVLEGALVSI